MINSCRVTLAQAEDMTRSVTKSVQINSPASAVFHFANDPGNPPQWAIHNVHSVRACGDGLWELEP